MIKQVVIVGGGSKELWPEVSTFNQKDTTFIGVDRGALYTLEEGFPIEEAVGDFDSLTKEEFRRVKKEVPQVASYPSEKDDTDMQLGVLAAIKKYPKAEYIVIGATGGRLDHYLSNIWIPLQERFMPFMHQIKLIDNQNTITYFLPGEYTVIKEVDKDYLAFVCLTGVKELTLTDAKYQLDKVDFSYPVSLSSNEFIGETSHFSFKSGIMCVIQSKDKIKRA